MTDCYADSVTFEDPAFGKLHGERAKAMWHMLLASPTARADVHYYDLTVDGERGGAKWTAKYNYGPQQRPVVNEVTSAFLFADGKIVEHNDDFNLWRWTSQALGMSGTLLGWSGFMRSKIQATTAARLDEYLA